MKKLSRIVVGGALVVLTLAGCAGTGGEGSGWVTLLDGGKWNVMEIHAQGPGIIVKLNDVVTSRGVDARLPQGPFTLQHGAGVKNAMSGPIQWRKVEIRSL